mmetsp:Transcript_12222/g.38586  ORF Transcript_12222/g.38586 Transcript_12222/m.38586 type:complete len:236 (-) Transcript_12222:464-1171(-)
MADDAAFPRHAAVQRDLRADDLLASARVRIATDRVGLARERVRRDAQGLVVRGRGHGRVGVELVDDVLRLVPPPLRRRRLGRDADGQDSVVHEMVKVGGLGGGDLDVGEPLDHTAADVAGDDQPHGEAVIRRERPPVLLPRDEHVVCGVERAVQRDRRAVRAVVALGQLAGGAAKVNVQLTLRVVAHARRAQQVGEPAAAPNGRRPSRRPPREADRLLDHVLLLAPVARADEENG